MRAVKMTITTSPTVIFGVDAAPNQKVTEEA